MNNKRINYIGLGLKFVQEILLYRQLRLDIETRSSSEISENEREYLLLKWEEGKVFPSKKTKINLLKNITSTKESVSDFENELIERKTIFDIENKTNTPKSINHKNPNYESCVGSYFYITAVISIFNMAIIEIENNVEKIKILKALFPLFESASQFSKDLRITSPKIKENEIQVLSLEYLQKSINNWFLSLKKSAIVEKTKDQRFKLVFRGLLKGIPYFGQAIDALIFGKE